MEHVRKESDVFARVVFMAFVIVQCLDGVLTYVGVSTGLSPEGNPIMRWVMSVMGLGLGIIVTKFASIVGGIFLYKYDFRGTLALITLLGLVVAIIPWIYIFLTS